MFLMSMPLGVAHSRLNCWIWLQVDRLASVLIWVITVTAGVTLVPLLWTQPLLWLAIMAPATLLVLLAHWSPSQWCAPVALADLISARSIFHSLTRFCCRNLTSLELPVHGASRTPDVRPATLVVVMVRASTAQWVQVAGTFGAGTGSIARRWSCVAGSPWCCSWPGC